MFRCTRDIWRIKNEWERWNVLDGTLCYTFAVLPLWLTHWIFHFPCISLPLSFLTFKQSVCFQGSRYALALWSALTERTPFQRALTTPGDLYKICKDHNKHLQKISIYRDHPGHTFHYVNCPGNHLTQACFPRALLPPRSVSASWFPVRLGHFLTEPGWPGHLRELSQQGPVSHHIPLIKQSEEGRKVRQRQKRWERTRDGCDDCLIREWESEEESVKKVRAHQRNK